MATSTDLPGAIRIKHLLRRPARKKFRFLQRWCQPLAHFFRKFPKYFRVARLFLSPARL
jgi:hypothetical protein